MLERTVSRVAVALAESGRIPDPALRWGIRRICQLRLRDDVPDDPAEQRRVAAEFVAEMRRGPIAPVPELANEQHYEVPAAFFEAVLGPRLKYSCCFFPPGVHSLADAEEAALEATCERAELADGQRILELGCGWGSLTLWMAERYPNAAITAVSNSAPQRRFIEGRAAARGLDNVTVVTADINDLALADRFDRVVSIEMFEHMRNYEQLLGRVASWLDPDGALFVHVFCHRSVPYAFDDNSGSDWMARNFFSGGIMPSDDIFRHFDRDLTVTRSWRWSGLHYQRTADAWLENLDSNVQRARAALVPTHGDAADRWIVKWRLFFLGCSELFGFRAGSEWWVSHSLLRPNR
jgi:cyclopropane-fatty-acyl-phospholipid synthase